MGRLRMAKFCDWLSRVYRPTRHIIGHIGDGFLRVKWPNRQCQGTEGSSGPKDQASIPPGPPHPCYKPTHAYNSLWKGNSVPSVWSLAMNEEKTSK